jgi:potassium efflux system protein
VSETIGVVASVGVRSIRITNLDNVELIVPNNRFMTDIVTNYTRSDKKVRIHVAVGVSYDSKPREVEEALLAAAAHPLVLQTPAPGVLFTGFGDSSLDFELLVWTETPVMIPMLASDLRFQIWEALEARDIKIPFPQRDIHIRTASSPASGLATAD